MGFFSWKTADTDESIRCAFTTRGTCQPVYLLQPGGMPPILEPRYEGYGQFGDVDAYEWLAKNNLTPEQVEWLLNAGLSLRSAGISLAHGSVIERVATGKRYAIFSGRELAALATDLGVTYEQISWDMPLPDTGISPNEMIAKKMAVMKPWSSFMPIHHPLKFSFSPDAIYEELPASKDCDTQGYF